MTPTESIIRKDLLEKLEQIRHQLSRAHHDINNPLAVISGNVELLNELTKALGVDEELNGPLTDIEKAVELLTENVDRLMVVRKILTDLSDQLSES